MDTGLISEQDANVILRLVIVLEGSLLGGGIDAQLGRDLHRQFVGVGLISESASPTAGVVLDESLRADLRLALANLNQRLRYALGDYDAPPDSDPGWTDQHFRFPSLSSAETFLAQARAGGDRGVDPVPWSSGELTAIGDTSWRVVVTIEDLWLTASYGTHVRGLSVLAASHGGTPQGSGGPGSMNAS